MRTPTIVLATTLAMFAGCSQSAPVGEEDGQTTAAVTGACSVEGYDYDGICQHGCMPIDPDCDGTPLGPEPAGQALANPIVLVHGFNANPDSRSFDPAIAAALERDGHAVYNASLPPFDGVDARAAVLASIIDQVVAEHPGDVLAPDNRAHNRRQREPENQRPENLPRHRGAHGERTAYLTEQSASAHVSIHPASATNVRTSFSGG